jgi:hypothetical protein
VRAEPPAPVDERRRSALRDFVRAALVGAPLAPHARREVDVTVTAADREHGSGKGAVRVPAGALAGPVSVALEMDGRGWSAATDAKKPHSFVYVLSLRKELSYLVGETCTAAVNEQGASFASISGSHHLEIQLGDTADGWKVGEIVLEVVDPG